MSICGHRRRLPKCLCPLTLTPLHNVRPKYDLWVAEEKERLMTPIWSCAVNDTDRVNSSSRRVTWQRDGCFISLQWWVGWLDSLLPCKMLCKSGSVTTWAWKVVRSRTPCVLHKTFLKTNFNKGFWSHLCQSDEDTTQNKVWQNYNSLQKGDYYSSQVVPLTNLENVSPSFFCWTQQLIKKLQSSSSNLV